MVCGRYWFGSNFTLFRNCHLFYTAGVAYICTRAIILYCTDANYLAVIQHPEKELTASIWRHTTHIFSADTCTGFPIIYSTVSWSYRITLATELMRTRRLSV